MQWIDVPNKFSHFKCPIILITASSTLLNSFPVVWMGIWKGCLCIFLCTSFYVSKSITHQSPHACRTKFIMGLYVLQPLIWVQVPTSMQSHWWLSMDPNVEMGIQP
jgi:hypothetical protein